MLGFTSWVSVLGAFMEKIKLGPPSTSIFARFWACGIVTVGKIKFKLFTNPTV
jgi:hypothetical protein